MNFPLHHVEPVNDAKKKHWCFDKRAVSYHNDIIAVVLIFYASYHVLPRRNSMRSQLGPKRVESQAWVSFQSLCGNKMEKGKMLCLYSLTISTNP